MSGPGENDALAQNVRYLIARFDEHLQQHQRDLQARLDEVRRRPWDTLMLMFTALASVSALVAVVITHH